MTAFLYYIKLIKYKNRIGIFEMSNSIESIYKKY